AAKLHASRKGSAYIREPFLPCVHGNRALGWGKTAFRGFQGWDSGIGLEWRLYPMPVQLLLPDGNARGIGATHLRNFFAASGTFFWRSRISLGVLVNCATWRFSDSCSFGESARPLTATRR